MNTKTIMIDGVSAEMDERSAQLVERQIAKLETEVKTAQAALATAQTQTQNDIATAKTEAANATALVQNKDAEITTLKQQLGDAKMSPQKLDKMVAERVATVQRAQAIIGSSLVIEGKTDAEMRRQVVAAKLGEVAKDWTDDMVTASFNTLSVTTSDSASDHSLSHVVQLIRNGESAGLDTRGKAYDDYDKALSERWKTAGMRNAQ